jgi:polysaccharide pyruvyl transferase WcaK-like protein
MQYAGKYSVENPHDSVYQTYLRTLVTFATWLVEHGYDVHLLIGDTIDRGVTEEFRDLVARQGAPVAKHVIEPRIDSLNDLLGQIAGADFVVATRFHNILLAMVLEKPVIAISFHHKCDSLMRQLGVERYSEDINVLSAGKLIRQFQDLERDNTGLKDLFRHRACAAHDVLEQQYSNVCTELNCKP